MKKYFLPIFAILLIIGCSNPPKEESSRMTLGLVQSVVEKGVNQTEIMKTLGAPNIISKDNIIQNSKIKLKEKYCDLIIANDVSKKDTGFNSDYNKISIIHRTTKRYSYMIEIFSTIILKSCIYTWS